MQKWKHDAPCDLYETVRMTQAVIFCNIRSKLEWLMQKMHLRDFTASAVLSMSLSSFIRYTVLNLSNPVQHRDMEQK